MGAGLHIAEVANLVGDPARANILAALLDQRALTASELAYAAAFHRRPRARTLANSPRRICSRSKSRGVTVTTGSLHRSSRRCSNP